MAQKRRDNIEVDEQSIMDYMAGEIPRLRSNTSPPMDSIRVIEETQAEKTEHHTTASQNRSEIGLKKHSRRKKIADDYESLFLARQPSTLRRQTYISNELHEKICSFLSVISREISVPNYINNILTHHMETYQDDINKLYERKSKIPFQDGELL